MRRVALAMMGALVVAATGAAANTSGNLELRGFFKGTFKEVPCPPESAAPTTGCYLNEMRGRVPGIGTASIRFTLVAENVQSDCGTWRTTASLTNQKGQIRMAAKSTACVPYAPSAKMGFTVTGGSDAYAGASGRGVLDVKGKTPGNGRGTSKTTMTGTLVVSGHEFDVTAPRLTGAKSITVRAPDGAERVRVRFAVTARDDVDGSRPVVCRPRPGSRFKIGRTRVRCSATDSSANTARAGFAVTIKRPHR